MCITVCNFNLIFNSLVYLALRNDIYFYPISSPLLWPIHGGVFWDPHTRGLWFEAGLSCAFQEDFGRVVRPSRSKLVLLLCIWFEGTGSRVAKAKLAIHWRAPWNCRPCSYPQALGLDVCHEAQLLVLFPQALFFSLPLGVYSSQSEVREFPPGLLPCTALHTTPQQPEPSVPCTTQVCGSC